MDSNVGSNRGVTSGTRKQDPRIGTLIADRYRILEVLGRGGMGVVYKAKHEMMGRVVAIKMLLPQLLADENAVPRFEREAKAASKINHPNIISLHDYGQTDDELETPYLVMDYIEGESLADVLKREGQLGVTRTVHVFLQVCDALAHAHDLGIIHRDLKPGNIMLLNKDDEKDIVKVVDFGVAKIYEDGDHQRLTSTGELFGSPVYMSPEQCSGVELSPQSDIYSLGCVMYECISGKLPLAGKTVLETIAKQMNGRPLTLSEARPDLYIPEWLEQCIFRALEKDPRKRHESMRALQNEIAIGASRSTTSQMKALNSSSSMRMLAITPEQARAEADKRKQAQKQGTTGGAGWIKWVAIAVVLAIVVGGGAFALNLMKQQKSAQEQPKPTGEAPPVEHKPEPVVQKTEPVIAQPDPPVEKPVVAVPEKPVKTPVVKAAVVRTPKHPVTQAPVIKEPVIKEVATKAPAADPPVTTTRKRKRRGDDFFDYVEKADPTYGSARELPTAPFSPQ